MTHYGPMTGSKRKQGGKARWLARMSWLSESDSSSTKVRKAESLAFEEWEMPFSYISCIQLRSLAPRLLAGLEGRSRAGIRSVQALVMWIEMRSWCVRPRGKSWSLLSFPMCWHLSFLSYLLSKRESIIDASKLRMAKCTRDNILNRLACETIQECVACFHIAFIALQSQTSSFCIRLH